MAAVFFGVFNDAGSSVSEFKGFDELHEDCTTFFQRRESKQAKLMSVNDGAVPYPLKKPWACPHLPSVALMQVPPDLTRKNWRWQKGQDWAVHERLRTTRIPYKLRVN